MADDSVFEQSNLEYKSLESKSPEEQSTIEDGTMDAVKNFAQKFANEKRFIALKISNWVLLLAVAILSTICGLPWLRLGNWSKKMQSWHSPVPKIGPEDHWNAIPVAIWAMFVLATFSLAMYFYGKKTAEKSKNFLSCWAVADICFSLFCLVNLLIVLAHFLSQATSEYIWFYPSLVNGAPLENLTEFESWGHTSTHRPSSYHRLNARDYNHNPHVYIDCDYGNFTDCENKLNILRQNANKTTTPRPTTTTTPRPTTTPYYNSPGYKLEEMEKRKRQILARLVLDPTVAILAVLAILVNIVYIFCIRKAMKQSNLRPRSDEESRPHCSEMDSAYGTLFPFGSLKILHWLIPVFLFHANLYRITEPDDNGKFVMVCWFGICFCNWISYVKSTRFSSEDSRSNRFLFIMDFVLYVSGIIFYLVTYFSANPWIGHCFIKKVSLVAIFFLLCSIFANFQLMFKYCGVSTFCQKFDRISINVSIVSKNDNQDSEPGSGAVKKTSENSASDGQEKMKDHNENRAEKGLDYIDI
ncbi:hypothetical protein DdX_13172 [Ditylenchus destructor]|uniref:Uncharacterized protein n=1 Tax=Ditylenchus destructor TaxID=166010 RepID=A0AAD4R2U0_9BILA|nr:hypothetical protein DdX_13172 [Ditylenchus destructor]